SHLENLLSSSDQKTLVSLMHANNEIGNITAIQEVGEICKRHNAIFHADTVQTVGHFPIDLSTLYVHFITASAHKFHGPKGTGILYIRSGTGIGPYIHGGGQERNMRAGTENIYGIVGFTKALELACETMSSDSHYISELKSYALQQLQDHIPGISFNGDPQGRSLYTVLNVGFPVNDRTEMMLLNLDIHHICASGGSACSSGADQGSHVIKALSGPPQVTIRFSFSKYNTKEEIDKMVSVLRRLI
ncbi:MAG: cysteine desulfurase family protein, partial [Chitinophagaceae bacterium]